MSKSNLIINVFNHYQFNDLTKQLNDLALEQQQLLIGVLGEFSAGKSSLINAMLGKRVLLDGTGHTTAKITEIHPFNHQEKSEWFLKSKGELTPISALEVEDELTTSSPDQIVVLHTKANDLLHEGYCIVDTPGISSLDETHTDITFGYLPKLDGAIICLDINSGGMNQSLKAFISKPE